MLPELRRSVFFIMPQHTNWVQTRQREKKKKKKVIIPKVKNSQMLTAVRWMTPWEVTGQPMKPTNCSSGQFSATARTDRSVTWRKKKSDYYLFFNDIQFKPFQLKKSVCPLSPFIYSAMFIGSRWSWSNSWLKIWKRRCTNITRTHQTGRGAGLALDSRVSWTWELVTVV